MATPFIYLIDTIFFLYTLVVLLRALLQWVRADFYNPVSRFVVKVTNPPLVPMRRIIPGFRGIDLASIVLLFLLTGLKIILIHILAGAGLPGIIPLIIRIPVELTLLLLNFYLFTIIVQVVLSWIAPQQYNPVTVLLYQLNEPILRPARRLIPPIEGLDLSPLVVLIAITFIKYAIYSWVPSGITP